jgi:type II secretory pathway component PulK
MKRNQRGAAEILVLFAILIVLQLAVPSLVGG